MLDRTHDPIADFINAVSADVMDFAAGVGFERFKEQTEPSPTWRRTRSCPPGRSGSATGSTRSSTAATRRRQAPGDARRRDRDPHPAAPGGRDRGAGAGVGGPEALRREMERAERRRAMEEGNVVHANRLKKLAQEEELRCPGGPAGGTGGENVVRRAGTGPFTPAQPGAAELPPVDPGDAGGPHAVPGVPLPAPGPDDPDRRKWDGRSEGRSCICMSSFLLPRDFLPLPCTQGRGPG